MQMELSPTLAPQLNEIRVINAMKYSVERKPRWPAENNAAQQSVNIDLVHFNVA